MRNNFIISLVVYPFDIMVSIDETDSELRKALNSKIITKKEVDWMIKSSTANHTKSAHFCMTNNNKSLIRLYKKPETSNDYGILQHEISHAVFNIMDKVGMKHKQSSDEAFAYLTGYITKEIYDELWKE